MCAADNFTEGEQSIRTAAAISSTTVRVDPQFVQHVLLQAGNDPVAVGAREYAFRGPDVVRGGPVLHLVANT